MPSYKLTYFNVSGRGDAIRILFKLADVPFEDVRVSVEDWYARKIATPLGNLPVLTVDGVEIGQTQAILRYLARQFGFDGSSDSLLISTVADSLAEQMADFVTAVFPWHSVVAGLAPGDKDALYESNFVPTRDKYYATFEKYLGKSSTGWIAASSSFTHADIWIGGVVEMFLRLVPERDSRLTSFPLLAAHQKKFLAVPKVAEHIANRPKDLLF